MKKSTIAIIVVILLGLTYGAYRFITMPPKPVVDEAGYIARIGTLETENTKLKAEVSERDRTIANQKIDLANAKKLYSEKEIVYQVKIKEIPKLVEKPLYNFEEIKQYYDAWLSCEDIRKSCNQLLAKSEKLNRTLTEQISDMKIIIRNDELQITEYKNWNAELSKKQSWKCGTKCQLVIGVTGFVAGAYLGRKTKSNQVIINQ